MIKKMIHTDLHLGNCIFTNFSIVILTFSAMNDITINQKMDRLQWQAANRLGLTLRQRVRPIRKKQIAR